MKISLIIPVYNAALFVEKAVTSAINFDCVNEIILIEDGSKDNSLEICERLCNTYSKVNYFTHVNNENLGAGASRNLGIQHAKNEWIAFLDADDIFLENRFDKEFEYFSQNKEFDGVYGALGVYYFSQNAKHQFKKTFQSDLTTVKEKIAPEKLKYSLLQLNKKQKGYFSLDTLTVKKSLIEKAGMFNTRLRLHQDTDLIIKLSVLGNLLPGNINVPISSRGVHENNRITSNNNGFHSRLLMYKELLNWFQKNYQEDKIIYKLSQDVNCYSFLVENTHYSIFKALFFTFHNKPLLYNDRYFNLLIFNSTASKKIKRFVIRVKEKIILTLFKKQLNLHSIYIDEQS